MPRAANIFYNLVTDENSTTELLCNLMRFSAFRTPFLRQFLSETAATEVAWEDFDTQVGIAGSGRPDLQIWTKDFVALIEIKVAPGVGLTANQPKEYIEFLCNQNARECWLVFLVPKGWQYIRDLERSLEKTAGAENSGAKVQSRIIFWDDVLEAIEKNDLALLNPFLHDFYELLMARLGPKPLVFSAKEILMLFSSEFPSALSHLQDLVDGVRDRSTALKVKAVASRSLCPEEYSLYFLDGQGKEILWFGVWTPFWKANAVPLCFGVATNSSESVRQAFLVHYKGQTKRFQGYIVGWFGPEILAAEDSVDQVWAQLSPLVEAIAAAMSHASNSNPDTWGSGGQMPS
jgi:hypothetical protein